MLTFYLIVIPLVLFLIYFFAKWKIRKLVMKKLADQLGLTYKDDKNSIRVSGVYKNKKVLIVETKTIINDIDPENSMTGKLSEIIVDDKKIFSFEGEIILLLPKKIIKIIEDYIEKGIMPTRPIKLIWVIAGVLWLLLIIAQIMMYALHLN